MAILIRDMEMPTCYTCQLESICGKWAKHDAEWQKENRDADCPLIELPPHGDLIDRDKLRDKWMWGYTDRLGYTKCVELIDLDDAPIVVESEET